MWQRKKFFKWDLQPGTIYVKNFKTHKKSIYCFHRSIVLQLNTQQVDWEDLYSWDYGGRECDQRWKTTTKDKDPATQTSHLTKDNGRPRTEIVGRSGHLWGSGIKLGKWSQIKFKTLQLAWFQTWLNDKETQAWSREMRVTENKSETNQPTLLKERETIPSPSTG